MSDQEPLPPELQQLLQAERERPEPSDEARARVRKRLERTLWVGAGAAVAGVGLRAALKSMSGTKLLLTVGAVALTAGGAVGISFFVAGRAPRAPHTRPVPTPLPAPPPAAELPAPAPAPEPTPAPPTPEPTHAAPSESSLSRERNLIEEARTDLARQRYAEAREALAAHLERYPNGQLAEERDALTVQLLRASGRASEADSAAREFRARYPNSVLLPDQSWPGGFQKPQQRK